MEKIKVVWLCAASNDVVNQYVSGPGLLIRLGYKLTGKEQLLKGGTGIWISNGIKEFESIENIELHVVSPVRYLKKKIVSFCFNTVNYHLVKDEESSFLKMVKRTLITRNSSEFQTNRKNIQRVINEIKPDIVHCIGLENPNYSMALLDVPTSIPTIAQLAALLTSILDRPNVQADKAKLVNFTYKSNIEKRLLQRANYIGLNDLTWGNYLCNEMKLNTPLLNLKLAMASPIKSSFDEDKKYDFVYFSLNLNKAIDLALDAFGVFHKRKSNATLCVIGAYDDSLKTKINEMLLKYDMKDNVVFEGRLPSHEDVISHIRQARFALLPLRNDSIPNVIREAMSNGLPVVTTITSQLDGTPLLNKNRASVLLSPVDDPEAMSINMTKLYDDPIFARKVSENAALTMYEMGNNRDYMLIWATAYKECINNFINGTALPNDLLLRN